MQFQCRFASTETARTIKDRGAQDVHHKVPGEIKRSRDLEEGGGAGLRKLDFFRLELFLNSNATDIVLVILPKHGS